MCTHYTLTYKCGHCQTSLRCPRSIVTHTTADGGTASLVRECANRYYLHGDLDDDCISCKLDNGLVPGQQTGIDAWAEHRVMRTALGLGHSLTVGGVQLAGVSGEQRVDSPVVDARKVVKRRKISAVGNVDPRLLGPEEQEVVPTTGGPPIENLFNAGTGSILEGDCEAKLRAALFEARGGNGDFGSSVSTASDGHTLNGDARSDTVELPTSPRAPVSQLAPISHLFNTSQDEPAPVADEDESMSLFIEAMGIGGYAQGDISSEAVDWSWGGTMPGYDGNED